MCYTFKFFSEIYKLIDHFNYQRTDLMNSVKSVCHNFESMSDNIKKAVLLYSDSHFRW